MKPAYWVGAGALLLVGLFFLVKKGSAAELGAAVGGAAVDAVVGVVSGAADAVADAANNPSVNPLQPFGEWLGGAIYDVVHPA